MAITKSDNWEMQKLRQHHTIYHCRWCLHLYTQKIAENFGKFYSTVGQHLAATIPAGEKNIDHYLSQIPHSEKSVVMKQTNQSEVEKLIKSLPNKMSSGHDEINNIMLKSLCSAISYQLQLVFNQSIATGTFPDKMKIAEVIPLYKGKQRDLVINYRPISLLMTISKLLEKGDLLMHLQIPGEEQYTI